MIGISIPNDSAVLEYDDIHGGFQGDGESYAIIQLTNQGKSVFVENANKSGKWESLPLSKEIEPIIIGGEYEGIDYGDGIFEISEKISRNIENGIYYFRDRYAEEYPEYTKVDIKLRNSYNFTICMLDIDNGKLYIFEYDS